MNNIINGNEGYLGNPLVKRDGIVQAWTQQEILEYQKCMMHPAYFARTYCKIISLNDGLVPFELYDYQEEMFNHFNDNRFSIVLACRQSGKSISSVAYLLWYALFNSEKNIAILANKGATAREMLSRVTLMLENLPFFLQPGTKTLNKGSIEFGNNSKIVAAATSGSSIRGLSISLLFLDEFAFIENATEFYTSTYPVISSGKDTKVIITSTANGIGNQFYNIWQGSIQKTNAFKSFRVDWWDVPGRDDTWKLETIANTSQLQFDQEFGNTFFGTGDTLIGAEALMGMKAIEPVRIMEGGHLLVYNEPEKNHEYVITVDVSKGRGQDYSTFNVIDVTSKPFNQVAVYRCNSISPILFPDIIYKYANSYNKAYVIVESNDHGVLVTRGLYHELEYENMHMSSVIKSDGIGIEMNRKVKRLGCSGIKDIIENNKIKINDTSTILECSTFIARGQSFEASPGNHDDLMMNLVMFGYFATTEMFTDMTDINLKQFMFEERAKAIEEDVVPFGFYDNGSEHMGELQRREDMGKPWAVDYDHTDF
jgi:hypothetical protein|tara:strand:- start:6801 stop:8417 length:1617 start_codon:yes stop_codon:yes gene_type:complete